uniref:G_PROTEIN_RECEP_F1_2 domain-containing protein n=1 Tax=Steinernema glaseri TaxID=37863 RepID=A0A1I7YQQ4_9BILA
MNMKTMLISLTGALVLFNITRFVKSFMYLTAHPGSNQSHANPNFANQVCIVTRFFYDTTENVFAATMCGLALERIAASVMVSSYASIRTKVIPVLIISAQWLSSTAISLILILADRPEMSSWSKERLLMSCSLIYSHPNFVFGVFSAGSVGFLVAAALLAFLYCYNSRQYYNRLRSHLNTRYQYAENITTLRFLVPIMSLFGASYLVSTALVANIFLHTSKQEIDEMLIGDMWMLEKGYNATSSVFTPLFFVLCIWFHRPLKMVFISDVQSLLRINRRNTEEPRKDVQIVGLTGKNLMFQNETDVYFAALKNDWSKKV